ncbi:MAG: hypothetical protein IMX05_07555 [Hydrogenibacillus schlegelii]|nr:hypothetical protein [Hydrogenibacillus schlegelii]
MRTVYAILLYLHIASVIFSIGPYAVLIPHLRRLRDDDPRARRVRLDDFHFAVRVSKHAGHLLVATGVLLWIVGRFPLTASWLVASVAILLAALFFLARAFSPTLRALEAGQIDVALAERRLRRALCLYLGVLFLIMGFMIGKPRLWD